MKRVIIDTDTAGDDTIAILTALHYFKVEGVTVAGGNVDFEQEVENALYTVQMAKSDYHVPVYKGYERPIMAVGEEKHITIEDIHGKYGMGDSYFEKTEQRPEKEHAVDFIIDTVKANPGEISLLAIAPLTNIAMAIKKDPTIVKDIPHLYIMGGLNNTLGNITAAAEYNFYVDPEAARIVMHSGIPITMVGWDMCKKHSVMKKEDQTEIQALGTAGSKFYMDVNSAVIRYDQEIHKLDGITHPDTLLVAIAADESIMTGSNMYYVDIEVHGELTRGYDLVDVSNFTGKTPNVRVCEEVDRDKFKVSLLDVLKAI